MIQAIRFRWCLGLIPQNSMAKSVINKDNSRKNVYPHKMQPTCPRKNVRKCSSNSRNTSHVPQIQPIFSRCTPYSKNAIVFFIYFFWRLQIFSFLSIIDGGYKWLWKCRVWNVSFKVQFSMLHFQPIFVAFSINFRCTFNFRCVIEMLFIKPERVAK